MIVKPKLLDRVRAKIRLKHFTSTGKRAALAGTEQRGRFGDHGAGSRLNGRVRFPFYPSLAGLTAYRTIPDGSRRGRVPWR